MPKALLIADTPWVVNEVKASLSLEPWEIVELTDPSRAAEVAEEVWPDVAIIDMQVDAMGGMAIIRALRDDLDPEDRPRTVLLLDRAADAFIARRAGADAHVLKPINAAELREAVAPEPAPVGASEEE
jgi:DNA-binding response OmpR family regulator